MDRPSSRSKQTHAASDGKWPTMPGQYPQTSVFPWPIIQNVSAPKPQQRSPSPVVVDPTVEKLLQWSAGIDKSIVEVNQKLEFLLHETKAFRGMETHYKKLQEQTALGTNLANSCQRLDIHQQNILDTAQKLGKTMKQVESLSHDIDRLKDGNEVTVSIKPTRK
ncbi:hypothetical protein CDEST_10917 [Colletotrichum destructivum]|uniref:Uncharacterized protein n=1 Tax=Colletotrichum destructivum TaxID=34406 RepID=A0AAX4IRR2_9PEZI|nr:hypothetical protein CDEST_10917 [Colletotrichum destructivum]